jgi:DNA adenine methylase
VGGKKALRKIIYKLFPKDFGRYIEVFGGGGWVLFGRPPDPKAMEVYNDFNSNLANMFYCVKNRTWEFLRHLGFLPINSRDEFIGIRKFMEKEEFDTEYLKQELELAQHNLPLPEFEDIMEIMQENSKTSDVRRAAAFFKLMTEVLSIQRLS